MTKLFGLCAIFLSATVPATSLTDKAPVWLENPIKRSGMVNQDLYINMTGLTQSEPGAEVWFQKTKGANWLVFGAHGFFGIPRDENKGENHFEIQACVNAKCADADLYITVN